MDFYRLMESLGDERCGLFFLAGLDGRTAGGAGVLTIHSAEGTLTQEQRLFIEHVVASLGSELSVSFRYHSSGDLYAPGNLESFARLFDHDHIVADPTGAFTRVSKLLKLARLIRAELGRLVGPILWQAHASTLVVVARSPEAMLGDRLDETIPLLIDKIGCSDLKRAIRSVAVSPAMPQGRYTPVDTVMRCVPETRSRMAGLLARISGIAALIGLGTMTAANANAPVADVDSQSLMPGITALVGLTTLGENSYGQRNHFQAVGGLRLYFGETGTGTASTFLTVAASGGHFTLPESPGIGEPEQSKPKWPMPTRVVYGG